MDAATYIELYGRERAEEVCVKAGTTFEYFYKCSRGYRRPSVELAQRLVDASDYKLDFVSLLMTKRPAA